jgi:hypothetical protein
MSDESDNTGDQEMEAAAPVDAVLSEHEEGGSESESRQVPLNALQSERAERQRLQDELRMMKDNMSLLMSQQQRSQKPQEEDEFEGISKDDVLTYGELEKILSKKERAYQTNIQELRMTQKYPDYQDVVTKYLPDVLKSNPGLANTLQQTNDYELAYYLAKNSDTYKQGHKKAKKNADAERIVQNANRAGSLSSVGQTSPINQAKRYSEMSDTEFRAQVNKNLGYM